VNRQQLIELIQTKRSFLCVGLDPDPLNSPSWFENQSPADGARRLVEQIIELSIHQAVAYKPNFAFFESLGHEGFKILEDIKSYIGSAAFIIGDAKRGDIGNTAEHYAKAVFHHLNMDAITVNPYMGADSITPFIKEQGKWAVVLGVTSNPGAEDFQKLQVDDKPLYLQVMDKVASWGTIENTMFVVGATRPEILAEVRARFPDHFFLVPGVGTQGGSLEQVLQRAAPNVLINMSRALTPASSSNEDIRKVLTELKNIQQLTASYIRR
jgi:orotidine-5'-phosphate decarboxylase